MTSSVQVAPTAAALHDHFADPIISAGPGTSTETVTSDSYRSAFRRHPGGVAVITLNHGGRPRGLTVSSFQSLSLDPPLVAFNIAGTSSVWPSIAAVDQHVVNLLGLGQIADARRFATSGIDRFDAPTRWTSLADGQPVLDSAAGWLHCTVQQRVAAGDHWLIISRVDEIHSGSEGEPLVFHDGDFHTTARILRAR